MTKTTYTQTNLFFVTDALWVEWTILMEHKHYDHSKKQLYPNTGMFWSGVYQPNWWFLQLSLWSGNEKRNKLVEGRLGMSWNKPDLLHVVAHGA